MIKIILADDHKLIREGLKAMLEESKKDIQVVGEACSGKEVIAMLTGSEAQVVLMDINMPEMDGLEAAGYIKEHFPHIKVLILSMIDQEKFVVESIKAGALGYILKTTGQSELTHAIQTVARGEQYIGTQIAMKLLSNLHSPQGAPTYEPAYTHSAEVGNHISKREMEVLQLIAQGYTNQQMADLLFTSKRTVESHRQSLLEKTNSKNTASLIVYASRHQLLAENKSAGAGS
jgi:DNA-binding NarL/FixJ family response regulator